MHSESNPLEEHKLLFFDSADYQRRIKELDEQLKESHLREKGLRTKLEHHGPVDESEIEKVLSLSWIMMHDLLD
jgi:hypothetical protein